MNIVTPYPAISYTNPSVNTESARRDNQLREVIPEPKASAGSQSTLDNKSASEGDKSRAQQQSKETQTESEKQLDTRINEREQNSSNDSQQQQEQQQEQAQIDELVARDKEVRLHEQAHASVGGQYAGAPSYDYQRGPDGKNYAVGGEVKIDVSEVEGEPRATINKMQQVRAAALAPVDPSSADRAIASEATQKLTQAQVELANQSEDDKNQRKPRSAFANIEPDASFERSDEVASRALRIAHFYQQISQPKADTSAINDHA